MSALPAALRRGIEPYDIVRGPDPRDGGLVLTVRAGSVDVELTVRGAAATAAAPTDVSGVYIDAERLVDGAVGPTSNDRPYAEALLADHRGALTELIRAGGSARLRFGRWAVHHPAPEPLRRVIELTARLALAPAQLGARWAALARALGSTWAGTWALGPGTRIDLDGQIALTAEHNQLGAAVLIARRHDAQAAEPLGFDPVRVCALAAALGVTIAPRTAAPASIAPIPIADWPSRQRAGGRDRSRALVTDGADLRAGLREELVVDGVAVRTRCDDALRHTEVEADCPGAEHLLVVARPGYRFLRSLFVPEPRLGDSRFDDRYVLDTSDLAWARWWLGPDEREAIEATFHAEATAPLGFRLADGTARFAAEQAPARRYVDAARLGAAFLAGRGDRATREWQALAATLGGTTSGGGFAVDGGLVIRTGRGAATMEITTARRAGGLVTIARAGDATPGAGHRAIVVSDRAPDALTEARAGRPPSVKAPPHHDAYASDAAWAAPRLAALAPVLATAAPDRIELVDDHAIVVWAGPLLDARRLTAGIELLARIARSAPGSGATPYR